MSNEQRDILQNRVLIALKAACVAHPSQRVTQVIVSALGTDPFYMEDEEAEKKLIEYVVSAKVLFAEDEEIKE